jgi:3-mercaptopyruvate sulfurtransferase SseA
VNVPGSMAANEDGTVKSDDDLQAVYTGARLDEGESTVAYCRIGERSSHTWFMLHELARAVRRKNYDVSGPSTVHWSAYRSSWAAKAYRHVWAPEQTQRVPPGTDLR